MHAAELTMGRTFAVRFHHGEDFFAVLMDFCREHRVRQGFIPMFIAGLRRIELVGTCERVTEPETPVWSSVHLEAWRRSAVGPSRTTRTPTLLCLTYTSRLVSSISRLWRTPAIY